MNVCMQTQIYDICKAKIRLKIQTKLWHNFISLGSCDSQWLLASGKRKYSYRAGGDVMSKRQGINNVNCILKSQSSHRHRCDTNEITNLKLRNFNIFAVSLFFLCGKWNFSSVGSLMKFAFLFEEENFVSFLSATNLILWWKNF